MLFNSLTGAALALLLYTGPGSGTGKICFIRESTRKSPRTAPAKTETAFCYRRMIRMVGRRPGIEQEEVRNVPAVFPADDIFEFFIMYRCIVDVFHFYVLSSVYIL